MEHADLDGVGCMCGERNHGSGCHYRASDERFGWEFKHVNPRVLQYGDDFACSVPVLRIF